MVATDDAERRAADKGRPSCLTRAHRRLSAERAASTARARADGFTRLHAGDLDEFELDDLIHHYTRSATELWKFCGSSGGHWQQAASTLTYLREQGEEPDWWAAALLADRAPPADTVRSRRSGLVGGLRAAGRASPPQPAVAAGRSTGW
jgi:hypothetical protein